MFMCNETVTLVQLDDTGQMERYRCTVVCGASWYAKAAISNTANGITTANVLKCRIPDGLLPEGVKPAKGDFLVRGVANTVETLDDLAQRERFRITAVGDNRRGRSPHWAVSGS